MAAKSTTKRKAATGKKTSSKTAAVRRTASASSSRKTVPVRSDPGMNPGLRREVVCLIAFLILLFVFLSLCMSSSLGVVGSLLNRAFLGTFGIGSYLLCIFGAAVLLWMMTHPDLVIRPAKLICIILLFIAVTALFHIFCSPHLVTLSEWYHGAHWYTGGVVGGLTGHTLMNLIGKAGAIILFLGLAVISLVVISERSFVKAASSVVDRTQRAMVRAEQQVSEKAQEHREKRRIRKEEEQLRAQEEQEELEKEAEKERFLHSLRFKVPDLSEDTGRRDDPGTRSSAFSSRRENETRSEKRTRVSLDEMRQSQEAMERPGSSRRNAPAPLSAWTEQPEKTKRSSRSKADEGPDPEDQAVELFDIQPQADPDAMPEDPFVAASFFEEVRPSQSALPDPPADFRSQTPKKEEPAVRKAGKVTQKEQARVDQEIRKNLERKTASSEWGSGSGGQQTLFGDGNYQFPSLDLLTMYPGSSEKNEQQLYQNARKLQDTLQSFGIDASVTHFQVGPTVTQYELVLKQGTKVSRITSLANDIALAMAASTVRIEAPIPGKSAVGIEIPNARKTTVSLREILQSETFRRSSSKLTVALGKTISGEIRVADLARMPHLLIAGATGSGKSVCINSFLISLLYKADPDEVKLILIDPKQVELSVYNGIPHLLHEVVVDPKKAAATLNWAVSEMTARYKKFAVEGVRDIRGYNQLVKRKALEEEELMEPMCQIVIVIDELADLMLAAGKEVETAIAHLTQMARAAGMYMVIATQRPSVDVITGVIKANIPSRLAFAVSSGVDSRTILDTNGAEKLLGQGDSLFLPMGESKAIRVQGAYISDEEVEAIVNTVKSQNKHSEYNPDLQETLENSVSPLSAEGGEEADEFLEPAIRAVVEKQKCSISMLQRLYRIGFNRAARLVDAIYERGIIGPDEGAKPRKVLMTLEEYEAMLAEDEA